MGTLTRWACAAAAAVLLAGCSDAEHPEGSQGAERARPAEAPARPAPPPAADALAALRARAQARQDSIERALRQVPGLSRKERAVLRSDVNQEQIAVARAMGVRAGGEREIARLAGAGRLVELEAENRYWVLRDLKASVPYVTPDTRAMLMELGERFQERLDSLGLPRFRMEITSAMRTAESQAQLRRHNRNASRTVSSHEFGTTVDVSHLRFAGPADAVPQEVASLGPQAAGVFAEAMDSTAVRQAGQLKAILGRVIEQMKAEGKLRVMMERQQAVFHMTVARRFPRTVTAN